MELKENLGVSTSLHSDSQNTTVAASETELINGSHAVMRSLLAEGVDTIFGYPGGAIMPVYDALYDYQDQLNHILVRHEQGAGHASEGYARMSGKVGVCLVTSGPGATNLVTAIADAIIDSTPMVCVIGQVAKHLLGTDAFQETDVMGVTMPITKWNYQVTSADEIPEVMAKAFYIAKSGRPGPVLIDITKNAQIEMMTKPFVYKPCTSMVSYRPRLVPKQEQLEKAAELINAAKKPFLFVGHGVKISGAEKALEAFLEKTGIPCASTLLGLSSIAVDHPLYMGWLGMHGNYGTNVLTNECDLIIGVGLRFDDRVTGDVSRYAKQAKIVHVDIDPSEIDKVVKADAPVIGDARVVLEMLLPLVKEGSHSEWIAEFDKYAQMEDAQITQPELAATSEKIKMAEVVRSLSDKTKGQAVIVADVGQHQMMAARYYQFKRPNSFITSGGLGTMGFALPAAFGAKVGDPSRDVYTFIGDGCFQMTIQELGTIAQSKLPVKIIILNNNFLGMVRQWQQLFHQKRYSFVELENPDFIAISKGFGIDGHRCTKREELSDSLDQLIASDKPYVLEVLVEKEENVFPMVPAGACVSDIRLK